MIIRLATIFCISTFGSNLSAQIMPSATELLARASTKAHPRTIDVAALKSGVDWEGRWIVVQNKVTLLYAETLPTEPLAAVAVKTATNEGDKTLLAAALWLRTGSSAAVTEAKRRALNLASWSPTGTTGFRSNGQAGRAVARTLALSYDWLYEQWTPIEKEALLSAIRPRILEILSEGGPYGLNNGLKLDSDPYDAHRITVTSMTAVICSALAGIDVLYDQCVIDIVPRYLSRPHPWGVNDGGYANGTLYAQYDVTWTHFQTWEMLKQVINVDLWQTAWAKNYIKFIAYFLPPGAPSGLFGDGAEQWWAGVWSTQGKAYAGYLPSPLANWYARSQPSTEEKYNLSLLLAPQKDMRLISTALPDGTAHGIHIPSIGWVAMHSDLSNKFRNSVYFKSSPYGSYIHSHADQNSFVIHAGGKVLAADTGYYDYFNSPHHNGWYKITQAHNAITVDGGKGQMLGTIAAKGEITQFLNSGGYDLVTGNARAAYGGMLTKAVRSMIYLRPDTVLVFDSLASEVARTWEWNIHALSPMAVKDVRSIEIVEGGIHLCVRQVYGPDITFSQTDKFAVSPKGTYPNQWHGVFATTLKSKKALFVTVLEVGCRSAPVTVTVTSTGQDVTVLGKTFSFDGISVLKK
jgi:hypothetical protein